MLRRIISQSVRLPKRSQLRCFRENVDHCPSIQRVNLQRIIQEARGSLFWRRMGWSSIDSIDEFRRSVSLTTYDEMAPELDQLKDGRCGVLTQSGKPVFFAMTSGTTGASKYIPVSRISLDEYRKSWTVWGMALFEDYPRLPYGKILQWTGAQHRERTSAGIPCGNITGFLASIQNPLLRTLYVLSSNELEIADPDAKAYVVLRRALESSRLRMITTAHPATLMTMGRLLERWGDGLLRDMFDGTITVIDPARLPLDIRRRLRSRRTRARQLLMSADQLGGLVPSAIWPELEMIAVWQGGSAQLYQPALRRLFGAVSMRDHGLAASEARVTIPTQDWDPAGLLNYLCHYYEFLPEKGGDLREAHELEMGARYEVILTTRAGLIRYRLGDLVECMGYQGNTPRLAFVSRRSETSDVAGEKLTAHQVQRVLKDEHLDFGHMTLAPEWGQPPHYTLVVENQTLPSAERLATIDRGLQQRNSEYRDKRQGGRLGTLRATTVASGTFDRFRQESMREGVALEQVKCQPLVADLKYVERMACLSRQLVEKSAKVSPDRF